MLISHLFPSSRLYFSNLSKSSFQASWYENWKTDPALVEPSAEDIKCELQLQALSTVEPLKWDIKQ